MEYTAEIIFKELESDRSEFLKSLYLGQSPNWKPNPRTEDVYCLGKWIQRRLSLDETLTQERRIQLLWHFNRIVRAEQDPFDAAAVVMNLAVTKQELEEHYRTYSRRPRPNRS